MYGMLELGVNGLADAQLADPEVDPTNAEADASLEGWWAVACAGCADGPAAAEELPWLGPAAAGLGAPAVKFERS